MKSVSNPGTRRFVAAVSCVSLNLPPRFPAGRDKSENLNLNLFVLQKWGRAGIPQTFALMEKGLSALPEEFGQFLCVFRRRVGGVSADLEFAICSARWMRGDAAGSVFTAFWVHSSYPHDLT